MYTFRKLLLLFAIFTFGFVGSFFIYRYEFLKKSNSLFQNRLEQEQHELKHALAVPQKKLDSYLYDYTFWDDMAEFAARPDSTWAKINIDNSMKTFHLYAEWILNIEGKPVYYTSVEESQIIKNEFLNNATFSYKKISENNNQAHFYASVEGKLFEVIEGTIQHGDDTTRNGQHYGYLFAALLIDSSFVNDINELTGDSLVVTAVKDNIDSVANFNDHFSFYHLGNDIDGNSSVQFYETVKTPTLAAMRASFRTMILLFIISWIIVILIGIYIVSRWITRPLSLITKSLQNEEDKSVEPLFNTHSEFGHISLLIKKFVAQKAELEEAKNIAVAENKAKTDFLSLISHELRTPLQSIIGLSDIIERSQLNSIQADQIKSIRTNGDLLLSVINDVLDFARMNAGEFELIEEEISLVSLMDDLIDIFSVSSTAKKIGLYYYFENDVPAIIKGDSFLLRQVLVNLINNAIKFTENGSVSIHISIDNSSSENQMLVFSVSDTGSGISPEDQQRIFKPFIQSENFSKRKKGGTGLGLAISQRIIEFMKGKIWLKSAYGLGTTFYFSIPVTAASGTVSLKLTVKDEKQRKIFVLVQETLLRENIIKLLKLWMPPFEVVSDNQHLLKTLEESGTLSPIIIFEQKNLGETEQIQKLIAESGPINASQLIILSSTQVNELFRLEEQGIIQGYIKLPLKHTELFQKLSDLLNDHIGIKTKYFAQRINDEKFIQPTTTMKILVVEDNKINQQILRLFLQRTGANTSFAESGLQAIEYLKKEKFDMVLMDLSMPEMDGITATKIIMADNQIAEKPIIVALTAHAFEEDKQKCFDAGMKDFMTKPLSLESFNKLIAKWDSVIIPPKKSE